MDQAPRMHPRLQIELRGILWRRSNASGIQLRSCDSPSTNCRRLIKTNGADPTARASIPGDRLVLLH
jgi:hypothetical protein